MFDIGFLELLIIGVVGLLVLGPERLPKAARTLGLWIGKIKRTVSGMQREISAQLEAEELRQKLDEQQKKLDEGVNRVKRDVEGLADTPSRDAAKPAAEEAPSSPPPEQRLDDALARARETTADEPDADAHKDSAAR
ncbi:Sec-independent protein translocase protein TatB [Halomonas sp. M4R1S46]|uniref:Sec-independent protein translocase protein TatB n=1 Tax=Halomonas sp. M4R1S46 TaxID=2982692 RepID=UPI0021E446B9|nr:Sec-independent protein translocase protein TatB [Halomonas sp. M4R1S46]UYG08208.1 Sec-independent protein translocase protein TatB [Halomonas sp. M4R1S46]